MSLGKVLLALIAALPEILKMIENLNRMAEQSELDRTIKKDLQLINKAFEEKDAALLMKVFDV